MGGRLPNGTRRVCHLGAPSMPPVAVSEQSAGLRRYADVLVAPGVARVVIAALLGRLPIGMAPLATVLLLRDEGRSYAVAGVVVAAGSVASAIGWPLWRAARRSRRPDARVAAARVRVPGRVRGPCAARHARRAGHCAGGVLRAGGGDAAADRGVHAGALAESAARRQGLRDTAYALEAWLQELFFVFGPLTIAAAIAVAARRGRPSSPRRASPQSAPSGSR